MEERYYANLQPSETAIFHGAMTLFSSYVASGQVSDENQSALMKKAIDTAVEMANIVKKRVVSDEELD